jgi:hypothetical protein
LFQVKLYRIKLSSCHSFLEGSTIVDTAIGISTTIDASASYAGQAVVQQSLAALK